MAGTRFPVPGCSKEGVYSKAARWIKRNKQAQLQPLLLSEELKAIKLSFFKLAKRKAGEILWDVLYIKRVLIFPK